MKVAQITIGYSHFFLPVDDAAKVMAILGKATQGTAVQYELAELVAELPNKYVTDKPGVNVTMSFVDEMPLPHFNQQERLLEERKVKFEPEIYPYLLGYDKANAKWTVYLEGNPDDPAFSSYYFNEVLAKGQELKREHEKN